MFVARCNIVRDVVFDALLPRLCAWLQGVGGGFGGFGGVKEEVGILLIDPIPLFFSEMDIAHTKDHTYTEHYTEHATTATDDRPVKSRHGANHLRPVSPFLPSSFSLLFSPFPLSLSPLLFQTPSLYPPH